MIEDLPIIKEFTIEDHRVEMTEFLTEEDGFDSYFIVKIYRGGALVSDEWFLTMEAADEYYLEVEKQLNRPKPTIVVNGQPMT